jgi:hypothetical protein
MRLPYTFVGGNGEYINQVIQLFKIIITHEDRQEDPLCKISFN